jgi:site-specific DNA recombinase
MSGTVTRTDGQARVAAIYARVSTERQRQEQTIASQTVALRELAEQRGLSVPDELVFEDDGFSGANLNRPGLERLRDRAFEGCFEVVLCHAPDRLARRYAYQVLLLEELARGGVEVVFAKEPERSGSPEDELLRQFQGMIAEYERAQIAERCRRGKLHRARAGAVSVLGHAPYGYRYVKRTEHADAFFEIDQLEAPVVREIFERYVERRESITRIAKSLTAQSVPTRTGTPHWGSSTIWAILRNPAYTGLAAYGRRRVTGEPAKPMRLTRQRGRYSGRSAYEHVGPEHWLRIPVPALIGEQQYALAQELLARNNRLSPRNTRKPSLLQGLLVCRECGHSYYRTSTRSKAGIVHHYYRCSGADGFRRPEGRVCRARQVRIDEIDEPVWAQVLALLENPELIKSEINRRLQTLRAEHPASHRRDGLRRDLTRAQNALRRLIDGYQEQLITLEELRARMPEVRKREATLRAELDALDTELQDAETYLKLTETLDAFRARLTANAENLTVEQRQDIVRLVVHEVLLGDDDITVRHSIPLPAGGQPGGSLLHSQRQSPAQGGTDRVRRRPRPTLRPSQGEECDPAPGRA